MSKFLQPLVFLAATIILATAARAEDRLPSWSDGPAKQAIEAFVKKVTDKDGSDYVSPADRIVVFDNDGNLWAEKPVYFQLLFAIDRVKALAPERPEWKHKQPFKAAIEGDMKTLAESGHEDIAKLVMAGHAGMSTEEFQDHRLRMA